MWNSVPKIEVYFCPDHWGGPFGPKPHEPSSYINKHNLHQKSHISGHLLRRPPLPKPTKKTARHSKPFVLLQLYLQHLQER